MLEHIIIIIGKLLWLLFLWVFLIFAYPITVFFAILGVDGSWEEVVRSTPYFLIFGLPVWILVFYVGSRGQTSGFRADILKCIAWLHYVFSPHRQSEILRDIDADNPDAIRQATDLFNQVPVEPPPAYKSENMGKKAEAYTERMRKEKEQLDAWIDLQETRARAEEYKKRRPGS